MINLSYLRWWPVVTLKYGYIWIPYIEMYSHFVQKQVAIVIVSNHYDFSHTYSCQAVADKLLARYDLSMISMLNKQDKKTFLSVCTCLTAGSVCDAVFTGLPARWAIKTKHSGTMSASQNARH